VNISGISIQGGVRLSNGDPPVIITGGNVTPVWLNAITPTSANANSTMQYDYTIVKTAANTYTVLASQQRFG
jgi:hypothetical protein